MWLADTVHANGMQIGLKNAVELVPVLVNKYDFALNEECHEWKECDVSFSSNASPFIAIILAQDWLEK